MTTLTIAILTAIIAFAAGFFFGLYYTARAIVSGKVDNVRVIR